MVFAKPVQDLTFNDIEALVNSGEPEGISLEYKESVDTTDSGKKKLAKHVSGFANSQGGYLLIGIAEENNRPIMPDRFVDEMLGQQKVEEWLEQVLNSNIAPRVSAQIKTIAFPKRSGECVVVVHVLRSPRVPHMVTTEGEKRYYKRHNFQTLPAEEYEVRDLFERGRRMKDEVERYLKKWGYLDPQEPDFGINKLTKKLGSAYFTDRTTPVAEPAHTIISFIACPVLLEERIDTSAEEFRRWLDPTQRHYYPPAMFIPHQGSRDILEGMICLNTISRGDSPHSNPIEKYLAVHRNGYVEFGYGDGQEWRGLRILNFVRLAGRFWEFLGFVSDLYGYAKLPTEGIIALNMANVEGTHLAHFGHGWRDLDSFLPRSLAGEQSLDRHIQVMRAVGSHLLDESRIEQIVRGVMATVGNAFGQDTPRCFNADDAGFPEDLFRRYEQ